MLCCTGWNFRGSENPWTVFQSTPLPKISKQYPLDRLPTAAPYWACSASTPQVLSGAAASEGARLNWLERSTRGTASQITDRSSGLRISWAQGWIHSRLAGNIRPERLTAISVLRAYASTANVWLSLKLLSNSSSGRHPCANAFSFWRSTGFGMVGPTFFRSRCSEKDDVSVVLYTIWLFNIAMENHHV